MNKKKILLTHSFKGGTGKTVVAINLVYYLSQRAKILYIDGDLLAPSLEKIIPPKDGVDKRRTWTDFLEGVYPNVEDVIYKTRYKNLDVIYSPPPEVGKSFMSEKKMNWWVNALKKELLCRERWFNELKYDYVLIDNQNGVSLNGANNITVSDVGFIILRPVTYGVSGTTHLVKEMYKTIQGIRDRKDFLIWNQIPQSSDQKSNERVLSLLKDWDESFRRIMVEPLAKIFYDPELSISMLEEKPDQLLGVSKSMQEHAESILKLAEIL